MHSQPKPIAAKGLIHPNRIIRLALAARAAAPDWDGSWIKPDAPASHLEAHAALSAAGKIWRAREQLRWLYNGLRGPEARRISDVHRSDYRHHRREAHSCIRAAGKWAAAQ